MRVFTVWTQFETAPIRYQFMRRFHEILNEKLISWTSGQRESVQKTEIWGAPLDDQLLHLYNPRRTHFNVKKSLYSLEFNRAKAHTLRIRKLKEAREKEIRQRQWAKLSQHAFDAYQTFVEYGEWDIDLDQGSITKAFRRLLFKLHPDHNPNPEANALTLSLLNAKASLLKSVR